VLICILIVSMVLTGAYVTTNRSNLRVLDSQERSASLKIAQGQLEQIRQNATTPAPNVFNQASSDAFCMISAVIVDDSDARCRQDSSGAPTADQPTFQVSVTRQSCGVVALPAGCSLFTVRVEWDSIATKTRAFEQLSYRLYQ
jgi:Tfp pilus assembly protein PilV